MAALHNDVFDLGLSQLRLKANSGQVEKLHILKADPGLTYADVTTHTLGNKNTPAISAPADRGAGGREVTISAITDGSVTATQTASHYALVDETGTKVLASGALSTTQAVTSGNTFTLTEFKIGIPDPA
jgi:hypothetical protein